MSDPVPSTRAGGPGSERRPPAKLNLLVRSEDGASFETQEITSPAAYLQLRPQRLPDEQWELAQLPSGVPGTKRYVLNSRRTENYLALDDEERFLWEQMDGRASLQDIAVAYVMRYGSFDFDKIPAAHHKLLQADLLTLRPMITPAGDPRAQQAEPGGARDDGDDARHRAAERLEPPLERSLRADPSLGRVAHLHAGGGAGRRGADGLRRPRA